MSHIEEGVTRFLEHYAIPRSAAARQMEEATLGEDVGLKGFTTLEQARTLLARLDLRDNQCLLDLGAGRGWPGFLLARESGCRLVSTDIPMDALVAGRASARGQEIKHRALWGVADGRELPFSSGYFDSIVHADVMC